MLEIGLVLDKTTITPYCKQHKIAYSSGLYLYRALDKGVEIASGLFEIQSEHVEVVGYRSADLNDQHIFDGILRAGFHYASEQGIHTGVIPEPFRFQFTALFNQLNFPVQASFHIENFFSKYKNCR